MSSSQQETNNSGEKTHSYYLLIIRTQKIKDKATIHERQQVIEKKGQATVEMLHQLHILWKQHNYL